jgi:hypothetical protein
MKGFRTCLLLIFALALSVVNVGKVTAGRACPAFTAEMIDAAGMAFLLSLDSSYSGTASYDPVQPSIRCESYPANKSFQLRINTGEDAGLATVTGSATSPTTADGTRLHSSRQLSSQAEVRACIAEALRSFVWNNFCDRFIEPAQ